MSRDLARVAIISDTHCDLDGHTHKQACDTSETQWVLKPGVAGLTRNHGGPSCLVLRASPEDWRVEAYRFPDEGPVGPG